MITPIIMESDMEIVKQKVKLLEVRGESRVHIDIGDGLFSDLLSIAVADLQEIRLDQLMIDFHLLVDDPTEYIEECVALKPKRVIGQIERMGSQMRYLETLQDYGVEGGLGLLIDTPVSEIEKEALKAAKSIILLEVPPGTSGSKFDMRVLDKIKQLRQSYAGTIIVDGGVNSETYKLAILAGADEAGANSWYWSDTNNKLIGGEHGK